MKRPLKLLSLGHSYVVGLNRRLAHEMSRIGRDKWEVTIVAPEYFHGWKDLRPEYLKILPDEPCPVIPLKTHLSRFVHVFFYDQKLREILNQKYF